MARWTRPINQPETTRADSTDFPPNFNRPTETFDGFAESNPPRPAHPAPWGAGTRSEPVRGWTVRRAFRACLNEENRPPCRTRPVPAGSLPALPASARTPLGHPVRHTGQRGRARRPPRRQRRAGTLGLPRSWRARTLVPRGTPRRSRADPLPRPRHRPRRTRSRTSGAGTPEPGPRRARRVRFNGHSPTPGRATAPRRERPAR